MSNKEEFQNKTKRHKIHSALATKVLNFNCLRKLKAPVRTFVFPVIKTTSLKLIIYCCSLLTTK